LEGQEERRDLFFGAFLRKHFHMDVLGVMRGRPRFFGLMGDLFVATIDPGIKFRKSDAEDFGDLFMGFDRSDHGAGFDTGKSGLSDAGLL